MKHINWGIIGCVNIVEELQNSDNSKGNTESAAPTNRVMNKTLGKI